VENLAERGQLTFVNYLQVNTPKNILRNNGKSGCGCLY